MRADPPLDALSTRTLLSLALTLTAFEARHSREHGLDLTLAASDAIVRSFVTSVARRRGGRVRQLPGGYLVEDPIQVDVPPLAIS